MSSSSSRNIPLAWTKHLPPNSEEKKNFEATLRGNVKLFTALRNIIQDQYEDVQRQEASCKDYSDGSWAYKQAHLNGMKEVLLYLDQLTDFIEGPNYK